MAAGVATAMRHFARPQHRGKLTATLWMILKTRDIQVAERTIRRALAAPTRGPAFEV